MNHIENLIRISQNAFDARHDRHTAAFKKNPAQYVARERYAWPGGYALVAITDDGAALCADCVRENYRLIRKSYQRDGWHVIAADCMAHYDESQICDHCGKEIN